MDNEEIRMDWYGVKVIKKLTLKGEPKKEWSDEKYDDKNTYYEEVIIAAYAKSFEHAYEIVEEKLKEEESYPNIYGQTVLWEVVEFVDCFLIYDEINNGTELYSSIRKVPKDVSDKAFVDKLYNKIEEGCWMAKHL